MTITYTVTVTEAGDDDLINPVTTTTDDRGVCDEPVGCKPEHLKGRFTYSVTVNDNGDLELANVVVSDDPRGSCDEPVGCETEHHMPGGLPQTGSSPMIGALFLAFRRRSLVGGGMH